MEKLRFSSWFSKKNPPFTLDQTVFPTTMDQETLSTAIRKNVEYNCWSSWLKILRVEEKLVLRKKSFWKVETWGRIWNSICEFWSLVLTFWWCWLHPQKTSSVEKNLSNHGLAALVSLIFLSTSSCVNWATPQFKVVQKWQNCVL